MTFREINIDGFRLTNQQINRINERTRSTSFQSLFSFHYLYRGLFDVFKEEGTIGRFRVDPTLVGPGREGRFLGNPFRETWTWESSHLDSTL